MSRSTSSTTLSRISTSRCASTRRVAESWANQALVYERRGELANARDSYRQALRLDPEYQPARSGLERIGSS